MSKKTRNPSPIPNKDPAQNTAPANFNPEVEAIGAQVLRKKKITTERRTTHTTNPHQSKTESRKTDDR